MRKVEIVGPDGVRRLAHLDQMDDERAEALLDQADTIHDLSGPEPITERGGVVHRRGRPDPDAESPRQKMKAEIAQRRQKPPQGGGKPSASTRSRRK